MSWRWVPPVRSPVSARAFPTGIATALGTRAAELDSVEAALRSRYDATAALLTDSGTSALTLALRALVRRGGTIAYPSYACIDLTTAALGAGVRVRLYDIDPATLSPDLDSVRAAIGRGVDAIVVAHLFGYPADISSVKQIAAEYGIPVIEDAAQAAGGTLKGNKLGSLGDISILSFGRGKGLTCGSGGALLVRTPAHTTWLGEMRAKLGPSRRGGKEAVALGAQWILATPLLYRIPSSVPGLKLGEMVFHSPREPRSISATAASMLPYALLADDGEVASRRSRASRLLTQARLSVRLSPIHTIAGGESGYLRLAVLDSTAGVSQRPTLGVVRGYPMTLAEHSQLWPVLAASERAGKGALLLRDRLLTLPTHSGVSARDLKRLTEWMHNPNAALLASLSPVAAS
jgi:perosamine synthetase